jgi:ATP-dependent exoDNAse (exonuclease V) alpha subunit
MPNLDINPDFARALDLMENSTRPVFVTGRAGTGKSTLLQHFRLTSKKKVVVLAPTGVAALNIDGQTIHSFFLIRPGITLREAKREGTQASNNQVFQEIETIIVDEISMVRADLFDAMDVFLKAAMHSKKPFGGKQIIMIGDLYQLPPVVRGDEADDLKKVYETPYFFSAKVTKELLETKDGLAFVELEKIYRQKDSRFIKVLNAVRNRSATDEHLEILNSRCNCVECDEDLDETIILTATNKQADTINACRLARLLGKRQSYKANASGKFPEKDAPTDEILELKPQARVMFLNNDSLGRWVNGSLGTVKKLSEKEIVVDLDSGDQVEVAPYTWNLFRFEFDKKSKCLERQKLGSFTQMPLRLAWAVTIHKSQGKTFERVAIDLGRGAFAAGQVYVALSRCRSLEGIFLSQPLGLSQLIIDYRVMKFLTSLQYGLAEKAMPMAKKLKIIQKAIEKKQHLLMTYLKAKDEKSQRKILPLRLGDMEFKGNKFFGLEAYSLESEGRRNFNVARILAVVPLTPTLSRREGESLV